MTVRSDVVAMAATPPHGMSRGTVVTVPIIAAFGTPLTVQSVIVPGAVLSWVAPTHRSWALHDHPPAELAAAKR